MKVNYSKEITKADEILKIFQSAFSVRQNILYGDILLTLNDGSAFSIWTDSEMGELHINPVEMGKLYTYIHDDGCGGVITSTEPRYNAVVINFIKEKDSTGEDRINRVITIECKDESLMPILQAEAEKYLNTE